MTADDEKYQGWTNYATWCVALWIDNEHTSYEFWRAEARDILRRAPTMTRITELGWSAPEAARSELALSMSGSTTADAPDLEGVYADLLTAALSDVDWWEIADNILSDVANDHGQGT